MTVRYVETSAVIGPNSMLALGIFQNEDFLNTPSQFYGVFGETNGINNRNLKFRTIPLNLRTNVPTSNVLFHNRIWDTFEYTYIGTGLEEGFIATRHSGNFMDNDYSGIKMYLLEKDI
jgi:hypothetical protein